MTETSNILNGFNPPQTHIYLDKQPNMALFCKPKIIPLKSPNLQMIEKLQKNAVGNEISVSNIV